MLNPHADPYHMNESQGQEREDQERHRRWTDLCDAVADGMNKATGRGGGELERFATNFCHLSADFSVYVEPDCPEALIDILEAGARAARDFCRR